MGYTYFIVFEKEKIAIEVNRSIIQTWDEELVDVLEGMEATNEQSPLSKKVSEFTIYDDAKIRLMADNFETLKYMTIDDLLIYWLILRDVEYEIVIETNFLDDIKYKDYSRLRI